MGNKNNTKHKGRREIVGKKNLKVKGIGVWKGSYMWNNKFLVVKKSNMKKVWKMILLSTCLHWQFTSTSCLHADKYTSFIYNSKIC